MASRRDELNAYTFAKRRMLAAYLQPSPGGSEEDAPRPLRGIVPGLIVGVIVLAVFGAWGMFKPSAPPGWSKPYQNVIIASDSTTRYVVLKTDGKRQLHPVLNMASAKLLLEPDQGKVISVDESVIDKGRIPHGATLGIPYAPDRLPPAKEADTAKRWAVCEQPGQGGRAIQKATFVLADREKKLTDGPSRLRGGELLYVTGPDRTRYVVDAQGTAYRVPADDELLLRTLVRSDRAPQRVSRQWLATLRTGDPVDFPDVDGTIGATADVPGTLDTDTKKVGTILRAPDGDRTRYYVVLPDEIAPVSDFTARLLLSSRQLDPLGQAGKAREVGPASFTPATREFAGDRDWPTAEPRTVNDIAAGGRDTVCNVLRAVDRDNGTTTLSTWAGTGFPAPLPTGSSSAYVTPGSGQLFRQVKGAQTKTGGVFLVTDTGLRYALQSNSDSASDDAGIGMSAAQRKEQLQEAQRAQACLGYERAVPTPVPAAWSALLPTGPRLSTAAARQPQGA
ncbi:type VII secretion protein EccB [Streptomyces uncialis]|uniref:type VII secretion protein EccB n=1 Tax=Streptomyces uncialis TaxID=1048205 RepID=UPI002254E83A|nr:type VII secretion protein EccB [Streptomyces uncialis]MCX4659766.1 type VII secretion protein EccB [Streptomyces uncialis]